MRTRLLPSVFVFGAACRALDPSTTPIATDRPGLLFASSVVPRGVVQLELGAPAAQLDRKRADEFRLVQLAVQARYGWSETLELRVGGAPYGDLRNESAAGVSRERGAADLELGVKYALAPTTSVLASARVPSGGALGSDDAAFSLFGIAESALDERRSLKGLVGWTGGEVGAEWVDTATLGLLLNEVFHPRFSGYVSAVAYPVFGSDSTPAYAGVGLAYLLSSDVQLDCSADVGLNDDALDALVTAGISLRW
ncbi:MAG: transporter [Planctomycetes bacterium]|nr:transporter [Planctomycetota bacterium]